MNQNSAPQKQAIRPNKGGNVDLMQLGISIISHWYWFLISIAVTLIIATLIVFKTTPTYTRSASLLIKTEDSNTQIPQELQDIGISNSNANLQNEIITIGAPVMLEEVVKRLGLEVQMNVQDKLHTCPLYDNAPIKVILPEAKDESSCSFKLRLNPNQTAELWDFSVNNPEESNKHLTVKLGTIARTPIGSVYIRPTEYFKQNYTDQEIEVSKLPTEAVGNAYAAKLSITLRDKESSILDISLTDASIQRADDVLRELIEVYSEHWLQDRNRMAESTYTFITERLNTLAKELGDVDQQISDYKSKNLLPDADGATSMFMSESAANNRQLFELSNKLSVARYIRSYMTEKANENQYLPSNTGIGSMGIESMIGEYNEKISSRNELLANTSEDSPYVQKINKELALMRATILGSLDNFISQMQAEIKGWEENEQRTNKKLAGAPEQVKQLLSIGRQQKVKETLYIYLLQKREENELSKSYTAWNTSIVQPPSGSKVPTAPNKGNIYLIALGIGFVIPIALLYLSLSMDHYVRGRADLDGMNVPLLGEIPALKPRRHWWQRRSQHNAKRGVYVQENNGDLINEAFRVLRTKLDYYIGSLDNNAKIVMLTSFNPGSGKSFIAANLAKVLSLKGSRVLAIDMDLRHCSLSAIINSPKHGLTDILSGFNENAEELIIPDALGQGADVLPVGVIPPNPTEMVLSKQLEPLFNQLREKYDYIILDCPPIDVVADTNIIEKYCDVTLFVVRAGIMDRKSLKDVDELYKAQTYKHMALLLNGTAFVSSRYGNYRYGYSYGYGYGYSYTSKK